MVRGLIGDLPKTAWVMSYSLFERIHYLLVAGFDVYGTMGHQLDTRLFMDFLRMEGEFNFIAFLPEASRTQVRDYWYEDEDDSIKKYVYGSGLSLNAETRIPFRSADPRPELLSMLRARLQPVHDPVHDLDREPRRPYARRLQDLAALKGRPVSLLPEMSVIAIVNEPGAAAGDAVFTITRDNFMTNVASLFGEDKRRRPDKDALTVARGIIGTYPNAYFRVTVADLPAFVAAVGAARQRSGLPGLGGAIRRATHGSDFLAVQRPGAGGILGAGAGGSGDTGFRPAGEPVTRRGPDV